jgi:hypothetical protein
MQTRSTPIEMQSSGFSGAALIERQDSELVQRMKQWLSSLPTVMQALPVGQGLVRLQPLLQIGFSPVPGT